MMTDKTNIEHATHILRVLGFTGEDLALQVPILAMYLDTYVTGPLLDEKTQDQMPEAPR